MKTASIAALMLGAAAWAGSGKEQHNVSVCMDRGDLSDATEQAQAIASKIFGEAGVKLDWHAGQHFCKAHPDAMIVSLSNETPRTMLPGALGYALPFEGQHIVVFYDRIRLTSQDMVQRLLAYVLVHEITHILEGTDRHSEYGIMKARWDLDDCKGIKPLGFTGQDVLFISNAMDGRAIRQPRAPLVSTQR